MTCNFLFVNGSKIGTYCGEIATVINGKSARCNSCLNETWPKEIYQCQREITKGPRAGQLCNKNTRFADLKCSICRRVELGHQRIAELSMKIARETFAEEEFERRRQAFIPPVEDPEATDKYDCLQTVQPISAVEPTKETAVVQPTKEPAVVQPTKETAVVQPTKEPAVGRISAYSIFRDMLWEDVAASNPDMSSIEINRIIGQQYRDMHDTEKEEYKIQAKERRQPTPDIVPPTEGHVDPVADNSTVREQLSYDLPRFDARFPVYVI